MRLVDLWRLLGGSEVLPQGSGSSAALGDTSWQATELRPFVCRWPDFSQTHSTHTSLMHALRPCLPTLCRYEQYITYGGAVLQVFQMYRLIVLPVANTWMSWSLLNKLGIAPSSTVVAATGMAVLVLIVAGGVGVQVRWGGVGSEWGGEEAWELCGDASWYPAPLTLLTMCPEHMQLLLPD